MSSSKYAKNIKNKCVRCGIVSDKKVFGNTTCDDCYIEVMSALALLECGKIKRFKDETKKWFGDVRICRNVDYCETR